MDIDTMITAYNTTVTNATSDILDNVAGKIHVLTSVMRGDFKKRRYESEGANNTRKQTRWFRTVKKAKGAWIGIQCGKIET